MLSSEQLHRCFHQLQHFMAAFNALCVLLNPGIGKVHAGEVDGPLYCCRTQFETACEPSVRIAPGSKPHPDIF